MCGIAGVIPLREGGGGSIACVGAMLETMRDRGPDDEGVVAIAADGAAREFVGPDTPSSVRERLPHSMCWKANARASACAVLGHRRLSILDLSAAGHQPMSDRRGRYWITFNGEVYNFQEIRDQLAGLGYEFVSQSDTEVVLTAFVHWGASCLARFNGDFAIAIWDTARSSLWLARDRMGVKPLYYCQSSGAFVFASTIRAILASGLHRAAPDQTGLYLSMALGMAPRPITAFAGVFALAPGHWMCLSADGSVTQHRYWSIPVDTQEHGMPKADAVAMLREGLQRAVARRLIADVPVGTFMSGGIDSTIITALAAQSIPGITALTLGFPPEAQLASEVPQARAAAALCGARHVVEEVDPRVSLEDLSTWVECYDEPYYDLAANHVVAKLARRHELKVVLNGLGGDELFGGYDYYRLPFWWGHAPRVASAGMAALFGPRLPNRVQMATACSRDRVHTLAFAKWSDRDLRRLFRKPGHLPCSTADWLHHRYAADVRFADNLEAMSFMDLTNYIGNHHVHRLDRFTMSQSIEGRFPFLDHELIELAFRIPSRWKVGGGEQKRVLRGVAAGLIPEQCLAMKKVGFGLPLERWMHGELAQTVRASIDRLSERSEFDGAEIQGWYKQYESGLVPPQRIWHLVSLELWFERFIDGAPAMP